MELRLLGSMVSALLKSAFFCKHSWGWMVRLPGGSNARLVECYFSPERVSLINQIFEFSISPPKTLTNPTLAQRLTAVNQASVSTAVRTML